ncbi:MAG: PQQ-dependent sugar dehydrogenase [Dehalococcoidia bacterium]
MRTRLSLFAAVLGAFALLAAACPRPNGYQAAHVFGHIDYAGMLALEPIPGEAGYVAVVTQGGVIYKVNIANPSEPASVFLDVRDRMIGDPRDEEGLLGLAFAPDYAASRRFYVYYTAGGPRRSVIARYAAGATANPASEQRILEIPQPYANHNGGALVFGPDGMLYIASGDGGSGGDPHGNGRNTNTLLGKILRIDVARDRYTIPADNPFASGGGRGEVWAYGLRNPWRITFDAATGQLWAGDVGQGEWEEVDRIVPGGNYGWNTLEGYECYTASTCSAAGTFLPRAAYSHEFGCSVTGGYVYRGNAMPELQGWYVYGDFCSGKVWAVNAATNEGAAIPLADTGLAISSFAVLSDGELYLVTFNNAIYRLERKP